MKTLKEKVDKRIYKAIQSEKRAKEWNEQWKKKQEEKVKQ